MGAERERQAGRPVEGAGGNEGGEEGEDGRGGRGGAKGRRSPAARLLRLAVEVGAVAAVLYLFVLQVFVVRGESMEPTLRMGDRLVAEKLSLHFGSPARFDVVVFRSPEPGEGVECVKRVVGLPTEEVELRGGEVYINGRLLSQGFEYEVSNDYYGPTRVPAGCYFVLGDNRPWSTDSRSWRGCVSRSDLEGVVRFRILPFSRAGRF